MPAEVEFAVICEDDLGEDVCERILFAFFGITEDAVSRILEVEFGFEMEPVGVYFSGSKEINDTVRIDATVVGEVDCDSCPVVMNADESFVRAVVRGVIDYIRAGYDNSFKA